MAVPTPPPASPLPAPPSVYSMIALWLDDIDVTDESITAVLRVQGFDPNILLSLIPNLNVSQIQNLRIFNVNLNTLMDSITKTLEANVMGLSIAVPIGTRGIKLFNSSQLDFTLRRNFLEQPNLFQQEGFGFYVDYKRPKSTLLRLKAWIEQKELSVGHRIFLIIFLTLYLILDQQLKTRYRIDMLQTYWSNTTWDQRRVGRLILYDSASWVFHPLTKEEDDEYEEQRGVQLLQQDRTREEQQQKQQSQEKTLLEIRILNTQVKIMSQDILHCIRILDYLSKQYHSSVSDLLKKSWKENQKRMKIAYEKFAEIEKKIVSLKLYDPQQHRFKRIVSSVVDTENIQDACIQNIRILFRVAAVLFLPQE